MVSQELEEEKNNSAPIHIRSTVRKSIPNHILNLYKKNKHTHTHTYINVTPFHVKLQYNYRRICFGLEEVA